MSSSKLPLSSSATKTKRNGDTDNQSSKTAAVTTPQERMEIRRSLLPGPAGAATSMPRSLPCPDPCRGLRRMTRSDMIVCPVGDVWHVGSEGKANAAYRPQPLAPRSPHSLPQIYCQNAAHDRQLCLWPSCCNMVYVGIPHHSATRHLSCHTATPYIQPELLWPLHHPLSLPDVSPQPVYTIPFSVKILENWSQAGD